MRRAALTLIFFTTTFALLVPPALAEQSDHGEGWWGETDDKVVTNAGFILIAFFPLLIALLSALQWRLDKRKEAKKAAAKARTSRPEWRGGW